MLILELNRAENSQHSETISSATKDENQLRANHHRSDDSAHARNVSTPSIIFEVNENQPDSIVQSSIPQRQPILHNMKIAAASNRIHAESSCSSMNSVRSAQ